VIDDPDSTTATRVAQPAIDHGFAFMSLQFRHPTASQTWYLAPKPPMTQSENGKSPPKGTMYPSTDIAATVQWARLNADKLRIDPNNIFLVGQSRGSLSVLTALMVDQKKQTLAAGDDAYLAYPSIPNAVFAAQAQTSYRDDQLKSFFLKNYASTAVTSNIVSKPLQFPLCREFGGSGRFDYWCHYNKSVQSFASTVATPLSAVDELGKTEPPIWLRYDRAPASLTTVSPVGIYVNNAGDYQDQPDIDNNAANCYEATTVADADKALKCFDVHHPHFGLKLRQTYLSLGSSGRTSYVFVQYADTKNPQDRADAGMRFYDNYYCFFMKYKTADNVVHETLTLDGEQKRKLSVEIENNFRRQIGDPVVDENPCILSENDVWLPAAP
jgi:hypothetical protein